MCDKAVVELPGPLESVSDCYKNLTMCDKAVLLANLCSWNKIFSRMLLVLKNK